MTIGGRGTVRVITGNGPESHVGDFATEEEADKWIATKSKDWPSKLAQMIPLCMICPDVKGRVGLSSLRAPSLSKSKSDV